MKSSAFLLAPAVCLALFTFAACGDDDDAKTSTPTGDASTVSPDGSTPTPGDDDDTDGGGTASDGGGKADAAPDAPSGPVISSDPNAPTTLAVGANVTANLAADKEHFFEFTTAAAGDYTLHLTTASGSKFYASFAMVKDAHSCGLPQCVQGTGTKPLTGLAAATTYYLNVYNGTDAASDYTISVTNP
jgi:hypothetical protein